MFYHGYVAVRWVNEFRILGYVCLIVDGVDYLCQRGPARQPSDKVPGDQESPVVVVEVVVRPLQVDSPAAC